MLSLKSSDEIAYDGSNNTARMDLFADTAADLTGVTTFDSIVLLAGSSALDISTGDLYRMQSDGTWILQPGTGAFSNVYTKAEIDTMLANYYTKTQSDDLYEWITVTISTDILPLLFIADGSPLTTWTISGNGQQIGTPTPSAPITPDFVGTLDGADWTIPITVAEQTTTVNLGEVPTVRRIRKLVLDGTEENIEQSSTYYNILNINLSCIDRNAFVCSHFDIGEYTGPIEVGKARFGGSQLDRFVINYDDGSGGVNAFKQWLAAQYAAGHPVTVWYVLANEQTGSINEPLAKIGTYADELSSTDADVTIPTVKGNNALFVDTTIQPSEMSITGKIRET